MKITKDAVIIGSGPAGASCAYTLGKAGVDTLLLEKGKNLGGAAGGGMGIFAVGTDEIKAMNYPITVETAYKKFLETSHYMANARVVRETIVRSREILDWLKGCGVRFEKAPSAYFQGANFTWHKKVEDLPGGPDSLGVKMPAPPVGGPPAGAPPAGGPSMDEPEFDLSAFPQLLDPVYEIIVATGHVEILKNARALHILMDNGAVAGLVYQAENGEEITVSCKAVFIATGGFAADKALVKANTKYTIGDTVFNFGSKNATGDGLRMAREAGAAGDNVLIETIACMEPPCNGPGGVPFNGGILRQPTMLMVNYEGERFVNEENFTHFGYMGNAVYRQKKHTAFVIFDEATNKYYEDNTLDYQLSGETRRSENFPEFMRAMTKAGYPHFFEADTVEELAEKMGVDAENLKATVDEYNLGCAVGKDSLLFKSKRFLRPVGTGKLYAARFGIGTYGSMGGIRIDHRGRVLDGEFEPITGLYAGGFDANSIFGDTFPFDFAGIGSTFSYVYGRVGGEGIIKQLGK